MGATGAGKTSIIQLLQRMYDATGGAIYLDGMDIRTLSLEQLRTSVSFVMQDVFLFSDTIGDNIKLGKKRYVDFRTVRKASTDAQASGFIERMEKQYDTVIGERGVGLSGGQKQRISIARALSKKNPILVLDDSTSALDTETEQLIQQTLAKLENTTKIIIGHRISAVRHADEILVLEGGAIAERGTHEELMGKHGLYYETYLSQYGETSQNGAQAGADSDKACGTVRGRADGKGAADMEKRNVLENDADGKEITTACSERAEKTGGETDVLQLV